MCRRPLLLILVILSGCLQKEPQLVWRHPAIQPDEMQTRLTIDSGECNAYAYQAIKVPAAPNINSQEVNITVNAPVTSDEGNWNAFQQGMMAAEELRRKEEQNKILAQQINEHQAAVQARSNLAKACMAQRGWQQMPKETEGARQ